MWKQKATGKKVFTREEKLRLTTTSGNRVLFLGPPRAGKSSTAQTVVFNLSSLTKEIDRTVIAAILHWRSKKITFTLVDLGGHKCYRHSSHFFYVNSRNNISLFFHDITSEDMNETLWWFQSGLNKAPESQVVIVITKIDLVQDEEERKCKIEEFKKKLGDFLDKEIKHVSKMVRKMQKNKRKSSKLARLVSVEENYQRVRESLSSAIFPVSCKPLFSNSIDALKKKLISIAEREENRVILTEEDCELYLKIGTLGIEVPAESPDERLGASGSPTASTASHSQSTDPSVDDIQLQETKPLKLGTVMDFFEAILYSRGLPRKEIKRKTQEALVNLHYHGLITYYMGVPVLEDIVFNNINTLIKLLETVFHHDIKQFLSFDEIDFDGNEKKFQSHLKNLEQNGVMSPEILKSLLLRSQLEIEPEGVLRLLEQMEVGFTYKPDDSGKEHVFIPFFVDQPIQREELHAMTSDLSQIGPKRLSLHGMIKAKVSPVFFHILVVMIYKDIHHVKPLYKATKRWNNCFFADLIENNTKLMFLLNEKSEVEFFFQSDIGTVEQHRFLLRRLEITNEEQEKLTEQFWPGLASECLLICTCTGCENNHPCEHSIDDLIADDSSFDNVIVCDNSSERPPRGIMLNLSRGKEDAQLASLHKYLSKHSAVSQTQPDVPNVPSRLTGAHFIAPIAPNLQNQTPVYTGMTGVSGRLHGVPDIRPVQSQVKDEIIREVHLKSPSAHGMKYECSNPALQEHQQNLEQYMKVTPKMLDKFFIKSVISEDEMKDILQDERSKGKAKRLILAIDTHGEEAIQLLINYLEDSGLAEKELARKLDESMRYQREADH